MKKTGALFTMRGAARELGGTDSRTVLATVCKLGIPTYQTENSILIDDAGLQRVRAHYNEKKRAKTAQPAA